ncbi:MAG: TRASH domain protein [Thermodesulfobacteriota bacterium]
MHPLRVVIIGLLLYILYRLLVGGRRAARPNPPSAENSLAPAHDVLVRDPVCQIYVPKGQAIVLQEEDTDIYFCSERCRDAFRARQRQGEV